MEEIVRVNLRVDLVEDLRLSLNVQIVHQVREVDRHPPLNRQFVHQYVS